VRWNPRVNSHSFLLGLMASISILLLQFCSVFAQSPLAILSAGGPATPPSAPTAVKPAIDATATINLGGQSVTATSRRGLCDRVGLQPNQIVDVTVQFFAPKAGHTITVEPLDAGRIIGASGQFVVAADGTIKFTYQAGREPGISQISLHDGAQEIGLQFWVLDQQHPENNPPVVNSGN
jgi:hypothetical protein